MIANNNNLSLSKLMEFNDITSEGIIDKDQYIFLHKKAKTGNTPYYVVQAGESLYEVAQKNAIQLKYLLHYNNLPADVKLQPNSRVVLQPVVRLTGNTDKKLVRIHVVAPKEGLYSKAKKYEVTVQQLKDWNKLSSDKLKTGQEIRITK